MSVYTNLNQGEIEAFLRHYDVGGLVSHAGIADGIENTNYFVTTTAGEFVLTLFEAMIPEDLPFCLGLMAFLAEHGLPTPHPMPDREGSFLRILKDRHATLVRRLQGKSLREVGVTHCREIGRTLGRMHSVGADFPLIRHNPRGAEWREIAAARLRPHLPLDDLEFMEVELATLRGIPGLRLPQGVLHADLFRDNALFTTSDGALTGLIDFYYACRGPLLYDLAITVNDWCSLADGSLDPARACALLNAYASMRPVSREECAAWPLLLRAAAMRFWVSRLLAWHFPRVGELTHQKDPAEFFRILQDRARQGDALNAYWR
jgi:homoserine kinase type II